MDRGVAVQEALFQELGDKTKSVRCLLCPHKCLIPENGTGICGVRKNSGGRLFSLVYSRHSSAALDPVEKKPLYHFFPGSEILSFGTLGCNLKCGFCQNWSISQSGYDESMLKSFSPGEAAVMAVEKKSLGIAYTYNEPLINYEWVLDTSVKVKEKNLKNVLVTNGYINEEPLRKLLPYIDAANVDIKSFRNEFYKGDCGGSLSHVLRTAEIMFKAGVHLEFTNLLIPGRNDSEEEICDLADWVSALSENIPLHFSRYFPGYKFTQPPTPEKTLLKAKQIADQKLKFVFLGNIGLDEGSDTLCPACGNLLISRRGYSVDANNIKTGLCSKCKKALSEFIIAQ